MAAGLSALLALAAFAGDEGNDPAQIVLGERLFLETRFAQAYFANPDKADPVMDKTITAGQSLAGPFAGKSMNCRACHMVDEFAGQNDAGTRSYADFARTSPIPDRGDMLKMTGRNSMSLVNISVPPDEFALFHFDGEFNSMADLVFGTLTGRNYGWQAHEQQQAIQHIAKIVRNDSGEGELAREFGGRYSTILKGENATIAEKFRLPVEFRIDVDRVSDKQVVMAVSKLIAAYVTDLAFARDGQGHYEGSPYDLFLQKNRLPRKPAVGETPDAYSQRLLQAIDNLASPQYVTEKDGKLVTHQQAFVFAEKELDGMKLFFRRGDAKQAGGNCVSCHHAPHFSDYNFHNTGLTQLNYDAVHGKGAFAGLDIPGLSERKQKHDAYLPASVQHPAASSQFRSAVSKLKPGHVDLGLWNIYANPDKPAPQKKIHALLCEQQKKLGKNACNPDTLLNTAIASFKTPVLRDLGHSAPYMHSGQFDQLSQAISLYISSSELNRKGLLRHGAHELNAINIRPEHVEPLSAFLRSLNEDYD